MTEILHQKVLADTDEVTVLLAAAAQLVDYLDYDCLNYGLDDLVDIEVKATEDANTITVCFKPSETLRGLVASAASRAGKHR